MKKNGVLAKFLSSIISVCVLSSAISAYEFESDIDSGLYLISETETVLDDGTIVVDKFYSDSPENYITTYSVAAATSGTETVKHSKTFTEKSLSGKYVDLVTIWVQASFTWNSLDKTAIVDPTTIKTGKDILNKNVEYKDEKTEYDSNLGFEALWAHKYAYVRYFLTLKSTGLTHNVRTYEVYIDMNTVGQSSPNDGVSDGSFSLMPEFNFNEVTDCETNRN